MLGKLQAVDNLLPVTPEHVLYTRVFHVDVAEGPGAAMLAHILLMAHRDSAINVGFVLGSSSDIGEL